MIRFYFSFTLKKKDFFKEYVKFIYFIIFKITTIQGYLVMVWLPRHLPKSRDVEAHALLQSTENPLPRDPHVAVRWRPCTDGESFFSFWEWVPFPIYWNARGTNHLFGVNSTNKEMSKIGTRHTPFVSIKIRKLKIKNILI